MSKHTHNHDHKEDCDHDHHLHPHHEHHFHGHHHHGDLKNIGVAFLLNLSFTIIEIIGGILTNSVAILSDALHDFGDSLALGMAWYFQKISEKGRDKNYSYGYKRFSVLGALITSIILIVGSVIIIYSAIERLMAPEETHGLGMIGFAILGVIVNGAAILQLRKTSSINARAVMIHLMEDVLGWVAVLIGSIFIYFFEWYVIDPILSLLIALYILVNVYKTLKQSLNILLQAIPSHIDLKKVQESLEEHEAVVDVHDTHIWSLDGEYNIISTHVVLNNDSICLKDIVPIKLELEAKLKEFKIDHSTIAFETIDEDCGLEDC
jgi:cobalt-zinc-cadmium efflux system protein